MTHYLLGIAILLTSAAAHWGINMKRDRATKSVESNPDLNLPAEVGPYRKHGEDVPPDAELIRVLETSSILMRRYAAPNGQLIWLTIVYAGEKRRSLHFPEVCLVGQGWEVEQAYAAPVGIEFEAKRLVIFQGDRKDAVLYWFKTGDAFTSSAFVNALFWARQQLMFGTPTSSMIKLSTDLLPGQDEAAAFSVLDDFASRLGPIVREAF